VFGRFAEPSHDRPDGGGSFCCVPMAMPSRISVAFCRRLGFARRARRQVSVLLGSAFLARPFWGWLAAESAGLQTLLWIPWPQDGLLTRLPAHLGRAACFAFPRLSGWLLRAVAGVFMCRIRQFLLSGEGGDGGCRRFLRGFRWSWRRAGLVREPPSMSFG